MQMRTFQGLWPILQGHMQVHVSVMCSLFRIPSGVAILAPLAVLSSTPEMETISDAVTDRLSLCLTGTPS